MTKFKKCNMEIDISPTYPKISNLLGAYVGLIENWDDTKIESVKELKTLGLNDDNEVICEITFPVSSDHNALLMNVAKSLYEAKNQKAVKVILGQNQPNKLVYPNDKEKTLARKFINQATEIGIKIEDLLIVSDNAYYSFARNGIAMK